MIDSLPHDFEGNLAKFDPIPSTIAGNLSQINYLLSFLNGQYSDDIAKYVVNRLSFALCTKDDYKNTSHFMNTHERQITVHPSGHYLFYQHFIFGYNEMSCRAAGDIALLHQQLLVDSVHADCRKRARPRVRAFDLGGMIRWENEMFGRPSKHFATTFGELFSYELEMGFLNVTDIQDDLKFEFEAVTELLAAHGL